MSEETEVVNVAVTAEDLHQAAREIGRGGSVEWLSLEGVDVVLVPATEVL